MKIIFFSLVALLSACSSPLQQDGAVLIKWHVTKTPYEDARRLGLNVVPMQMRIIGFKYFDGEVCHVFTHADDLETLGHEVKHCFEGSFHKEPALDLPATRTKRR